MLMGNLSSGDMTYSNNMWLSEPPPPHVHGFRMGDLDQQVFTEQDMLHIRGYEHYLRSGQGSNITAAMPPEMMDAALALMSPTPPQSNYGQGAQPVQHGRPRHQAQRSVSQSQRSNSLTMGYSQQQSPSALSPHATEFTPQYFRPHSSSFSGHSSIPMAVSVSQQQQQQPQSAGPVRNGSVSAANPHDIYAMRAAQSHLANRNNIPTSFNFGSDMNFNASGYMPPANRETETQVTERLMGTINALEPASADSTQPSTPVMNRHLMGSHGYGAIHMPEQVSVTSQPKQDGIMPNGFELQPVRPGKRKRTVSDDQDDAARRNSTGSGGLQDNPPSARPRSTKLRKTSHGTDSAASSGPRRRNTSTGGTKPFRVNLTEEEKRNNHILSEQKRRNLIKNGFDELNHLVPELQVGGMSKSNILLEVASFIQTLLDGNKELCQILGEDFSSREKVHIDAVEADKAAANSITAVKV